MPLFPTQYSVLKASALRAFLSEAYNVAFTEVRFLIHNVSDTYLVWTADNRFVFKIYRASHRSKSEILAEVELLNYLHKNGAQVSFPMQTSDGGYLVPLEAAEGLRYGVLWSYAQGEVKVQLSDRQLRTVGVEMARIHILSSKVQLTYPRRSYTIETTLREPLRVLKSAFDTLPDEYSYLQETAEHVEHQIRQLKLDEFGFGYSQFDFLPKNFHFDSADNVTFFDFDFAGPGYLINDITSFYIHFFLDVTYKKLSREEADRSFWLFVTAYREIKPITDAELRSIKLFGFGFWMFYLQFQYEHFDDWSNFFFTPRYLKERVALIRNWMDY